MRLDVISIAIVGLLLGSFLSVLLERLNRKEGIVAGRSECPHCQHVLAWYDLIPLFSFALLAGRCRYCRGDISWRYPILEIAVAVVLGAYVFLYGLGQTWQLSDLILLFGLVALFFFDLRYQILPDQITFTLLAVAVLRLIFERRDLLINGLATGLLLASFFGLLYIYSKGQWLGLGDVKLSLLIGVLFGYPGAVGVTLLAIWAGALVGLGLMAARRAQMNTALPFGSFWTAVAMITIIWPGPVFYLSGLLTPILH